MVQRPGDVWSNGSTVRLLPVCALQLPPFHSTTSTQLKIVFCTEWNDLIYVRQKRVHWMFAITRGRSSPTSFGWHLDCIEGRHKRNSSSLLHNNLVPFCTIIEIQLVFSGQGEGRRGDNAQIRGKHDKRHFIRPFLWRKTPKIYCFLTERVHKNQVNLTAVSWGPARSTVFLRRFGWRPPLLD